MMVTISIQPSAAKENQKKKRKKKQREREKILIVYINYILVKSCSQVCMLKGNLGDS